LSGDRLRPAGASLRHPGVERPQLPGV